MHSDGRSRMIKSFMLVCLVSLVRLTGSTNIETIIAQATQVETYFQTFARRQMVPTTESKTIPITVFQLVPTTVSQPVYP